MKRGRRQRRNRQTDGSGNSYRHGQHYGRLHLHRGGAGAYTVTPSKSGYTFTPASTAVTITTANATVNFATVTYTITGTISGVGGNGATASSPVPPLQQARPAQRALTPHGCRTGSLHSHTQQDRLHLHTDKHGGQPSTQLM